MTHLPNLKIHSVRLKEHKNTKYKTIGKLQKTHHSRLLEQSRESPTSVQYLTIDHVSGLRCDHVITLLREDGGKKQMNCDGRKQQFSY